MSFRVDAASMETPCRVSVGTQVGILRLRSCLRFAKAVAPLRMTGWTSVDRPYIVWQNEHECAVSRRSGAGEDSAAEDFYRGVVGEG